MRAEGTTNGLHDVNPYGNTTCAEIIAQFAANLRYEDIPDSVRERAKHLILDAIGIAYAAGRYEFAQKAASGIISMGDTGSVPVIGLPLCLTARDAATMNGILVHGLDFDDSHLGAAIHATASVLPCAMSSAWGGSTSGADIVKAYVAGMEVAIRLGMLAGLRFRDVGFHPTALLGTFGATIAAGILNGLDRSALSMAQGIALSMTGGSFQFIQDGAWSKRLHPGWAAQSGIVAAHMARFGFTGPRLAYEGRFGLFGAFLQSREIDLERIYTALETLGHVWEIADVAIKPVPACHFTHACSDAAATLRRQETFALADVEQIITLVPQAVVSTVCEPVAQKKRPETAYAAQFSMPYIVAASLARGEFTLKELENSALTDPVILSLAGKVEYKADPNTTFPRHRSGEVRIRLRDGREFVRREAINRGCPDRPLSNDFIVEKFNDNIGTVTTRSQATHVREQILSLDTARDGAAAVRSISGGASA